MSRQISLYYAAYGILYGFSYLRIGDDIVMVISERILLSAPPFTNRKGKKMSYFPCFWSARLMGRELADCYQHHVQSCSWKFLQGQLQDLHASFFEYMRQTVRAMFQSVGMTW